MRKSTLVIVLLCLVGLADATYLTWDHLQAVSDPDFAGGLCSTGGGCDISRNSPASAVSLGSLGPALPISILALAFYLAFLALQVWRSRRPEDPDPRRIQLGLAVLASAYSIALLILSVVVQGALCPFCSVLYAVNLLLLATTWRTLGEPIASWFKTVWRSIPRISTGIATAVFTVGVVGIYLVYALSLNAALNADPLESAVDAIDVDARPTKGSPEAPVHIIEFADIECPHCRILFENVEALQRDRPNDVQVTFMHFPLDKACNPAIHQDFHINACWLAAAADCAGRQGKGFEALAVLFEDHKSPQPDIIKRLVGVGVNEPQLTICMADDETQKRLLSDINQGLKLGITGTPVFFVNGHKLTGGRSRADLEALVNDAKMNAERTTER